MLFVDVPLSRIICIKLVRVSLFYVHSCPSCDGTPTRYEDLCGLGFQYTLADPSVRTFNRDVEAGSADDNTKFHPWRAPGTAPVLNSCGVAGGTHNHPCVVLRFVQEHRHSTEATCQPLLKTHLRFALQTDRYSQDGAMYPGDWNGGASHPGP